MAKVTTKAVKKDITASESIVAQKAGAIAGGDAASKKGIVAKDSVIVGKKGSVEIKPTDFGAVQSGIAAAKSATKDALSFGRAVQDEASSIIKESQKTLATTLKEEREGQREFTESVLEQIETQEGKEAKQLFMLAAIGLGILAINQFRK